MAEKVTLIFGWNKATGNLGHQSKCGKNKDGERQQGNQTAMNHKLNFTAVSFSELFKSTIEGSKKSANQPARISPWLKQQNAQRRRER